ncbi:MAG: rhodanese-like domain-containing protein [Gammaproteobacteria bacterium]|nr:rhodanese-like domain-containing protein [Gammaproteobacteria bacterium]
MAIYLEFVKLNWHLFLALFAIIALLPFEPLRARRGGIRSVSADELPRVMRDENIVILDVSDAKEFAGSHIAKARNIPISRLDSDIQTINKFKSRPIVVCCRVGNRSAKAAGILKRNGFTNIRTLHGGMAAWTKENLPVES